MGPKNNRKPNERMSWPNHFPPSCPPADATAPRGLFFRFVRRHPVPSDELKSKQEKRPLEVFDEACLACGVSLYERIEDLDAMRRAVGGFKKMVVAAISLDGAPGQLKQTRLPSHHTWWIPEGEDKDGLAALFTAVERK